MNILKRNIGKMEEENRKVYIKIKKDKGVTLIALVVTIIVLLILAGVSVTTLTGENGVITQAVKSKKMTELAQCKEEYQMFISEEMVKDDKFKKTSLTAGETNLIYNTQKPGETGNIYNVMPSLKNNEYSQKIEIIKGDLLLNTKDPKEIQLAQSIGIQPNPYDIVNGELLSSNGNLLLMDETGTVTIPDRVTKIGDGAFRGVDGLKTIIIPGTVKEIGNHAFSGNQTLENVIIEEGVEKIGNSSFEYCSSLKKMYMPNSVNDLGARAFLGCVNLLDFNVSNNIKILSNNVFSGCRAIKEFIVPEGVEELDWSCLALNSSLYKVTIPKSCKKIHDMAFQGSRNLNNIEVDKENINFCFENGMLMSKNKDIIFYILENKEQLVIPETINILGGISGNFKIKEFFIPKNVTKIEGSFNNCVERIDVDNDNVYYKSVNGNLFDKKGEYLVRYCKNEEIVNLEEGLKRIRSNAFSGRKNIKKINLPETLEELENFSLGGSNKEIYIGKNLKRINTTVFDSYDCNINISRDNPNYMTPDGTLILSKDGRNLCAVAKDLESYNIPSTVENISPYSFYKMYNLKEIKLPINIKTIEASAFGSHGGLKKIEIQSSIQKIVDNAFQDCSSLKEIIIDKPKDSISGSPWGNPFGLRAVKWLR